MVQKASLVRASQLVLSSALAHNRIEARGNEIAIGASATVSDLERSELLLQEIPHLAHITKLIASPQIRSRATVAGNIVNASPIGDLAILLLALDASLVIEGAKGSLSVPLERFFLGYKRVDLRPDELIVELLVPKRGGRRLVSFEKVSKREHLDIATVNSACAVEVDEAGCVLSARLSAGGVAPVPKVLEATSQAIVGRRLDSIDLGELIRAASSEISPIDDVRGSAAYKSALLERMIAAHFESLVARYATLGNTP
jgi:xanthine dehydrogenase small subunit